MLVNPMSDWLLQQILGGDVTDFSVKASQTTRQISTVASDNPYSIHWREWHLVSNPTQEWFVDWLSRIPNGCGCVEGFVNWVKDNPPEFEDWFPYSVRGHNFVNAKIGRPLMSVDEARSLWFPNWEFLTLNDLNAATLQLAAKLPPIRGVAGVPVSGMLCAPVLSTILHVPLYEASYEFGIRRCTHGYRGHSRHVDESLPLLVVDDTISSGRSLSEVRNKLQGESNLLYAVPIASVRAADQVDFYGRLYAEPHLLEWNLPNTGYIRTLGFPHFEQGAGIMVDFDGVLCPDPTHYDEETESGRESYLKWIADAPLGTFVSRMYPIPDIVSYRCEYTREASETWLAKHGIKYERLHLWGDANLSPAEQARSRIWSATHWKGKIYRESKCGLFVESCERQSRDIAGVAKKPVLCWDTKELIK
jgi:uncharacterized HAD superfamily protein